MGLAFHFAKKCHMKIHKIHVLHLRCTIFCLHTIKQQHHYIRTVCAILMHDQTSKSSRCIRHKTLISDHTISGMLFLHVLHYSSVRCVVTWGGWQQSNSHCDHNAGGPGSYHWIMKLSLPRTFNLEPKIWNFWSKQP